ncbi:MAG: PD-(D/E)XK nuclease domain-containing protein, partial [Planctomycetaceae bacterium]|nr:PD-(D/E)XK nuclease domain-containing protein [Planctomycetaceae bacterium]
GRVDAVWRQHGLTIVAEIKYHSRKQVDRLLDEAMKQIRECRYYEAYLDGKVKLIAIAFTGKGVKCRMESIN